MVVVEEQELCGWIVPQLQSRFLVCGALDHYVRYDVEKNISLQFCHSFAMYLETRTKASSQSINWAIM